MPSASIRTLLNGSGAVTNASRDDLAIGDSVTVESANTHTTYSWTLAYKPPGSTATFSGSATASSPGHFMVDVEGPYLIRLIADLGLPTESTQFVRARILTSFGSLRLVAAGEGFGGSIPVPVDATPTGWTDQLNTNLTTLLGHVARSASSGSMVYVDPNVDATGFGDYSTIQEAIDAVAPAATVLAPAVVLLRPGQYTENVVFAPFVHVYGWPPAASAMDNRSVIVRGNHSFDASASGDMLVMGGLTLESVQPTTDATFSVSGPGLVYLTGVTMTQAGVSSSQGPTLSVTGGLVTLQDCLLLQSSGLASDKYALSIGSSAVGVTILRSTIQGPSCILISATFISGGGGIDGGGGPTVASSLAELNVRDSYMTATGLLGLVLVSDSESVTIDYTTMLAASNNIISIHPDGGTQTGNLGLTVRFSLAAGAIAYDITGISGTTSLDLGATYYQSLSFPGGTPASYGASVASATIGYDNTSSGLTAVTVQAAIDEIDALASSVRTLGEAYIGGRSMVADSGAVQILDALSPSDPPPAGNTDGRAEFVGGLRLGAIGFPEIDLDPNPFGSGPSIRLGQRVIPNNIPFGVGTAAIQARSTGTPLYRNYNLRLQTESSDGGGSIGRMIVQGGDAYANGIATPDAASVYLQGGSAFDSNGNPGHIYLAPGRQTGGTAGGVILVDPTASTAATLTAAGTCADPIGVAGSVRFATNMGAVEATFLAGDSRATVVAKLDALAGISASQSGGVITLTTVHEGPNAEIYFLSASTGVDAALGTFDGQNQVDGSYGRTAALKVTAADQLTLGGNLIKTARRRALVGADFPYTLVATDEYLGVTSTAAPRTINLSGVATVREVTVKDESGAAGTNNITIAGGGPLIDGAASFVLSTNYGAVTLVSNGTAWFVKNVYP